MITKILSLIFILISFGLFAQDMHVTPGTKMTVKSSTEFNFINGSNLILKDDFSSAPSFLQQGQVNFSGGGLAHVEQYLTKDTWNMVSSPVSDGTIEAFEWMYLSYYTESDNSWHYLNKPVTQPLNAGQGYFVWPYSVDPNGTYPPSPDSAVMKGNLNYQNKLLILDNTPASPKSGWNLIGNSFPVALNWNGDASWNLTNIGASIYIKDPGSGNYVVWNYNTGGSKADSGYIAATQGFWVRTVDTTGTPAAMVLPASQRSHKSAAFYKSSGSYLPQQLMVVMEREDKTDKTIIGFIENATNGFDGDYDATYLAGDEDVHSLFSMIMGTNYAMNHLPSVDDYPIVPLGFKPKIFGEFTISATWIESFEETIPIFLEDVKEQYLQDLRVNSNYSFMADVTDDLHRFNIHFANPLGIDERLFSQVRIYAYEKKIFVKLPTSLAGDIFVYNLLGEQITSLKNGTDLVEIPVNASNSYFVVKVMTENGLKSKKVLIR